jgi:hypothetical protein
MNRSNRQEDRGAFIVQYNPKFEEVDISDFDYGTVTVDILAVANVQPNGKIGGG